MTTTSEVSAFQLPKEGDKFQSKECIHNYVCDLNQIHMQECVPNKWEQQEEEDKVCLQAWWMLV